VPPAKGLTACTQSWLPPLPDRDLGNFTDSAAGGISPGAVPRGEGRCEEDAERLPGDEDVFPAVDPASVDSWFSGIGGSATPPAPGRGDDGGNSGDRGDSRIPGVSIRPHLARPRGHSRPIIPLLDARPAPVPTSRAHSTQHALLACCPAATTRGVHSRRASPPNYRTPSCCTAASTRRTKRSARHCTARRPAAQLQALQSFPHRQAQLPGALPRLPPDHHTTTLAEKNARPLTSSPSPPSTLCLLLAPGNPSGSSAHSATQQPAPAQPSCCGPLSGAAARPTGWVGFLFMSPKNLLINRLETPRTALTYDWFFRILVGSYSTWVPDQV
jgi:hypothetical protein